MGNSHTWAAPLVTVCCLIATGPVAAHAQGRGIADTLMLDLAVARQIGLGSSPLIRAAWAGVASAQGARRQAGAYRFNPAVQLKLSSLIDPGDARTFEGIVRQEVEWAGQWGLRKSAADHGVTAAEGSALDATRRVMFAIDVAFFRAVAAARRLEVRALGLELRSRFQEAVRIEAREGQVSTLEVNLAQIDLGRARAAERAARAAYTVAVMELAHILGLPPEQPLAIVDVGVGGPDPRSLDPDSLLALALATRPDLRAMEAEVARADATRRLASREAIPNVEIAAVTTRGGVGEDVSWGLRFGLPLPLWNRNSGLGDQGRGETDRALAQRDAVELAIRTEIASALEAYRAAWDELAAFDADVLGPARANQRLLETAYGAGRLDLPTVMLLRTQLLDAELGYWDAWLSERTTLAALQAAVGEEVERSTTPP